MHGKSAWASHIWSHGVVASSWSSYAGQKSRIPFQGEVFTSPADSAFDVHFGESAHWAKRGKSFAWEKGQGAQGGAGGQCSLCGTQRGQMPTGQDIWFDVSPCECSRPQCSLTATEYAQPCFMLLNLCKQHSLDGNGRYICLFSVGTE